MHERGDTKFASTRYQRRRRVGRSCRHVEFFFTNVREFAPKQLAFRSHRIDKERRTAQSVTEAGSGSMKVAGFGAKLNYTIPAE